MRGTSPGQPAALTFNSSGFRKTSTRQSKMSNLPNRYGQTASFNVVKRNFTSVTKDEKLLPQKPKRKRIRKKLTLEERERREIGITARKMAAIEKRRIAKERESSILESIIEDMPVGYNLTGERGLICGIFVRALYDMIVCPHPNLTKKHSAKSNEAYSMEAAIFINSENEVFRIYCELLDVEPEQMENYLFKWFKKEVLLKSKKKGIQYLVPTLAICNPKIYTMSMECENE